MISGYREPNTHRLVLNTDYTAVYEQLVTEGKPDASENFRTVIPVAEILSASLFDWDAYSKFNPVDDDPSTDGAVANASVIERIPEEENEK